VDGIFSAIINVEESVAPIEIKTTSSDSANESATPEICLVSYLFVK